MMSTGIDEDTVVALSEPQDVPVLNVVVQVGNPPLVLGLVMNDGSISSAPTVESSVVEEVGNNPSTDGDQDKDHNLGDKDKEITTDDDEVDIQIDNDENEEAIVSQNEDKDKDYEHSGSARSSDDQSSSSGSGSSESETVNSSKKKAGQPKRKPRKPAVFIQRVQQRGQTARRSGKSLKRSVKDYQTKTGAKVFFQAQYEGQRKTHTYKVGKFWKHEEERNQFTSDDVKTSIVSAVQDTLQPFVRELGSRMSHQTPSTSKGSSSPFSPQKQVGSVVKGKGKSRGKICYICGKEDVVKEFITYHSEWIGCNGDGDEGSCEKWVHADCLGFPGVTMREIKEMPDFYCPDHVALGRVIKDVQRTCPGKPRTPPGDSEEHPSKKRVRRKH